MKIRTKFALLMGAVISIILLLTTVSLIVSQKQHLIEEAKKNRIALVKALRRVSRESSLTKEYFTLMNYVKTIKEDNETVAYAMFCDNENRIIAHTDSQFLRQIAKDEISIKSQASHDLFVQSHQMTTQLGSQEIVDMSIPVFLGEERVGTARIGFSKAISDRIITDTLDKVRQRILIVILVVFSFALLCVFVLAHTMTHPIRALVKGADLIAQGKLDTKIKLTGKDELTELTVHFNTMAEKLKELDEIKRDFVSGVTHELRSPLGAIETYINKMLDGGLEGFRRTGLDDLTVIKNNAIRLSQFINNLLDTAKIEAGRMQIEQEEVSIPLIVKDVITLYKLKAEEKKINLQMLPTINLPLVFVDADKIRQVLNNLIGNALKFTDTGGMITISAKVSEKIPDFIEIRVSDTGIGIPRKELKKIFDKFQQVKEAQEKVEGVMGTGLGLFIVKNIVELHGGKILAESPPKGANKGTAFIFTLPTKNAKINL